jgi:hypothetical protein
MLRGLVLAGIVDYILRDVGAQAGKGFESQSGDGVLIG